MRSEIEQLQDYSSLRQVAIPPRQSRRQWHTPAPALSPSPGFNWHARHIYRPAAMPGIGLWCRACRPMPHCACQCYVVPTIPIACRTFEGRKLQELPFLILDLVKLRNLAFPPFIMLRAPCVSLMRVLKNSHNGAVAGSSRLSRNATVR